MSTSSSNADTQREGSPTENAASAAQEREKASSPDEEKSKTNYYPITWRVISGGVMMGGKSASGSILMAVVMNTDTSFRRSVP